MARLIVRKRDARVRDARLSGELEDQLVGDGEIRVEISQTFALADVQRAHALSESGHARGKLILVP